MTTAVAPTRSSAWATHGGALALVAIVIVALFLGDAADLARIWWTSTTFGHCLFIGPVIAWLVWQRRGELARLDPVAWGPGLALVAVGGVAWLLGDAGGVALARHLGLVLMMQGAVVTILGPNVARGLLFPLAYALFLVPFGEGLEPPLQAVTVAIVMPLLQAAGIAASVDGVLIHAGRYYFEVAEACSGALAIGWRWFDRAPDDPAFDPATLQRPVKAMPLALAGALVVATAAAFPTWSAALATRVEPLPPRIDLPEVSGWQRVPLDTQAAWQPNYPGADHQLFGRYADASGQTVDMAVAVYARQHEGAELVGFGIGVLREADRWVRVADEPVIAGGTAVRITAPGPVERIVATWYRVGHATTGDDTRVKIETMKARLFGGPLRAVAVHLSAVVRPGQVPRDTIERFAHALGPIDRVADRMTDPR